GEVAGRSWPPLNTRFVRMLIEHYLAIRTIHIASVTLSGSLFMLRGLLVQLGRKQWALTLSVRYLSYLIDITLLATGVLLVTILPWALCSNGWLLVKLGLVAVYVVLGVLAMKRGRSARIRVICYLAALLTFLVIVGIALAHHPLGWLFLWFA